MAYHLPPKTAPDGQLNFQFNIHDWLPSQDEALMLSEATQRFISKLGSDVVKSILLFLNAVTFVGQVSVKSAIQMYTPQGSPSGSFDASGLHDIPAINGISASTLSHVWDVTAPIQGQLDGISDTVSGHTDDIAALDGRTTVLEEAESSLSGRVTAVEEVNVNQAQDIGQLQTDMAAVEQVNINQAQDIAQLQTDTAAIVQVNVNQGQDISAHEQRLDDIDASLALLDGRVTTLESTSAEHTGQIASLSTQKADISYVDASVAALVDSAPEVMNTLAELSAALGNDEHFATTISYEIGTKAATTYVNSQDAALQSQIDAAVSVNTSQSSSISSLQSTKADTSYVNTQDASLQSQIDAAVSVNTSQTNSISSLQSTKADKSYVDSQDASLQSQIDAAVSVNTSQSSSISSLQSTKADTTYVDSQDANLQSQIDAAVSVNTSQSSSITSLQSTKADTSYVNSQISTRHPLITTQASLSDMLVNDSAQSQPLSTALSTIRSNHTTLSGRVTTAEGNINGLQTTFNALSSDVYGTIQPTLTTATTNVAALLSTDTSHQSQITALQSATTGQTFSAGGRTTFANEISTQGFNTSRVTVTPSFTPDKTGFSDAYVQLGTYTISSKTALDTYVSLNIPRQFTCTNYGTVYLGTVLVRIVNTATSQIHHDSVNLATGAAYTSAPQPANLPNLQYWFVSNSSPTPTQYTVQIYQRFYSNSQITIGIPSQDITCNINVGGAATVSATPPASWQASGRNTTAATDIAFANQLVARDIYSSSSLLVAGSTWLNGILSVANALTTYSLSMGCQSYSAPTNVTLTRQNHVYLFQDGNTGTMTITFPLNMPIGHQYHIRKRLSNNATIYAQSPERLMQAHSYTLEANQYLVMDASQEFHTFTLYQWSDGTRVWIITGYT